VLYLANPSTERVRDAMRAGLLGCIDTPAQGNRIPDGALWCADNGAYSTKGWPGEEAWYRWLANHPADRSRCLFAVAPDVVGDATATINRSARWLEPIRALGYPVALAAQDGLEHLAAPWSEFDVLFVGGSTSWKLGAAARDLIFEARRRGMPVHMGRVNSLRRLRYATAVGCTTADGTYLAFGPDQNLPAALGWMRDVNSQDGLFQLDGEEQAG
jgi:hypothetical protein